ncbi:hypothetical protein RB594_008611 [Gaeumannomyces avenae]
MSAFPRRSTLHGHLDRACQMSFSIFNPRLLVVSLGNPAPLHETFHSAGHIVLRALQPLVEAQPRFTSDRFGKKTTDISLGDKYMLVTSPCSMNTTGPWLAQAWKQALQDNHDQRQLGLVLLQDELELELGDVRTRTWDSSHKGHNGIRSSQASLKPSAYPENSKWWTRLRVGIGRPAQRDRASVSNYVLGGMSAYQKSLLREKSASGVLRCLEELEVQWRQQWEKDSRAS